RCFQAAAVFCCYGRGAGIIWRNRAIFADLVLEGDAMSIFKKSLRLSVTERDSCRRYDMKPRPRAGRHHPRLECLESRLLPTLHIANSLADGPPAADGQLTLRQAILAATTNAASGDAPAGNASLDVITFAQNLAFGTIKLQSVQGLLVLNGGGNINIIGPIA